MKIKNFLTTLFVIISVWMNAQSNQVVNAYNYLRNKEYANAKTSADAAITNESTKSSAKLWMYRGKIYQAIYESKKAEENNLDADAQEKAVESYVTCLKLDKDNIYKDEVKGLIVQSTAALNYKAGNYYAMKDYDKAIKCYDLLETALPFDFDEGMKRNNVTKEKIMFSRYKTYSLSGNKEKTIELGNKMIDSKYKDPTIYISMSKIYLIDKDTAKALSYIEKGRLLFDDNADLMNQEIDIYLAQKKTDVVKNKLIEAINVSPDNEVLHTVLAGLYDKTNDKSNAEKEYLAALELKPDDNIANYNLGVMYFNTGNEWNQKLNALPMSETKKAKEYETNANDYFKKAVVNLEKAYEIAPDKATKQRLRQLCLKLGETEKAEKYK